MYAEIARMYENALKMCVPFSIMFVKVTSFVVTWVIKTQFFYRKQRKFKQKYEKSLGSDYKRTKRYYVYI